MSDGAGSRGQGGKPLPENRIVRQTSKALEEFFATALSDLETKLKHVLQPTPGAEPTNGPLQLLTEQMIRELSANVRRVLGTAKAPDPGVSTAAKDAPDLRTSPANHNRGKGRRRARRKRSGRRQ
ncbi:MAG TPA: hypothetical protein VEK75_05330 [Xanthobacteraceae bacterium]|nr:hypothetical protein [Xanthobacteraceae bacterium]